MTKTHCIRIPDRSFTSVQMVHTHTHFVRACRVEMHVNITRATLYGKLQQKCRGQAGAPWSSTSLYTYRKNPSVWTHCLGTTNSGFSTFIYHLHAMTQNFKVIRCVTLWHVFWVCYWTSSFMCLQVNHPFITGQGFHFENSSITHMCRCGLSIMHPLLIQPCNGHFSFNRWVSRYKKKLFIDEWTNNHQLFPYDI